MAIRRLASEYKYDDFGGEDLAGPSPAPAAPSPAPVAPAAPTDPYAAIRNLNFTYSSPTEDSWIDNPNSESGSPTFQPGSGGGWSTDFEALRPSGFQSKYNRIEQLPDGTLAVTLQRPGAHKYDTMKAIYAQGADGQWQLQDAHSTRQKGSGLSAIVKDSLLDIGVSERIAEGLSGGPGSSAALMVNDIARGLQSLGVDRGALGTINEEVLRNSEADIYDNARAASRAAAIAAIAGGGAGLASAAGGGASGAAASGALFGGATQAQGSGEDILKGALIGGIGAGAGQYIKGLDAASRMGITDPTVADIVNKAVQSGATSALKTGTSGGDLEDIAASFGTGALTSGIGAGAGELLQNADIDPRLVNLAIQANRVYENPTAGGILGLAQSGAGYFKEPATDVVGEKYPELGGRTPLPVYESIDNSGLQPFEPISLPEIPEMAKLNGVAPESLGSSYDLPGFALDPSLQLPQSDLEYFLSTNIPYGSSEPATLQDLMAQYYPEQTQAPSPVNPFADLPADEVGEVIPIIGQRTGVYDYDAGMGDINFPDPYGPDSGWGKDVLPPGYTEPAPAPAPAPAVNVRAPSVNIPISSGAPSPAPATKAKSSPNMAGLLGLLGAMGGGQQAAPDTYQVADVRNATMNEMLRSMGLSA